MKTAVAALCFQRILKLITLSLNRVQCGCMTSVLPFAVTLFYSRLSDYIKHNDFHQLVKASSESGQFCALMNQHLQRRFDVSEFHIWIDSYFLLFCESHTIKSICNNRLDVWRAWCVWHRNSKFHQIIRIIKASAWCLEHRIGSWMRREGISKKRTQNCGKPTVNQTL